MKYLLCRNRVKDYAVWHEVFHSDLEAQRCSGLILEDLWQDDEDPNNIFFIFAVTDEAAARAFMAHPDSIEAGRVSGVIDGEAHFVTRPAKD